MPGGGFLSQYYSTDGAQKNTHNISVSPQKLELLATTQKDRDQDRQDLRDRQRRGVGEYYVPQETKVLNVQDLPPMLAPAADPEAPSPDQRG